MHIYRLAFDPSYRSLELADPSFLNTPAFHFDSTSKADYWPSVDLITATESEVAKPEPDLWRVHGLPQVFVCSERVADLVPILWVGCEQLPVSCHGRALWLGNVTESGCYDALDVAHCRWPLGMPDIGPPSHYSFYKGRLGLPSVFTVPETCAQELYVYEYNGNPYEEFKGRVEHKRLSGLIFEEIGGCET